MLPLQVAGKKKDYGVCKTLSTVPSVKSLEMMMGQC